MLIQVAEIHRSFFAIQKESVSYTLGHTKACFRASNIYHALRRTVIVFIVSKLVRNVTLLDIFMTDYLLDDTIINICVYQATFII